jgi:gliding motility-associated-like protein
VQVCIPPVAAFSATPLVICTSGCTTFTDASTNNPTTWLWQFPGGVPSSSTAQNPGSVCYSTIGQFTVILVVTNTTGADTLIMPNYISVVNPIPVFITGNTNVNTCETTELTAMPAGTSYQWGTWLGSIECSTCQTATVTPVVSEQYWVHYTDVNGCTDDDTTMVTITAIYTYFMPTGFSPNGDNINDELVVHGRGVQYMNLKVFDRIGEKVFETSEWDSKEQKSGGWDGRLHGIFMNENTFVYELTVTFCNGQTQKENGSLMLVR